MVPIEISFYFTAIKWLSDTVREKETVWSKFEVTWSSFGSSLMTICFFHSFSKWKTPKEVLGSNTKLLIFIVLADSIFNEIVIIFYSVLNNDGVQ